MKTLRDELAEAADRWDRTASPDVGWHDGLIDALLPVVRRWAEQRAAEELRAAASELGADEGEAVVAFWLRSRADALDPLIAP